MKFSQPASEKHLCSVEVDNTQFYSLSKYREVSVECPVIHWTSILHHLPRDSETIEEDSKIQRLKKEQCLLNITGLLHSGTQVAVVTCTWYEQYQAGQHVSMEQGGAHEPPPPADGCQGKEIQLSSRVWSLVIWPSSSGWPNIHASMGSTSWTQWVVWKKGQEAGRKTWEETRSWIVEKGKEYDKNRLNAYKIF